MTDTRSCRHIIIRFFQKIKIVIIIIIMIMIMIMIIIKHSKSIIITNLTIFFANGF